MSHVYLTLPFVWLHSLNLVNVFICLITCIYESDDPKLPCGAFVLSQREKDKQRGGTSKKTIGSHMSDDESSSDSSDEEDSPRPLNYRTPMITQVSSLFPQMHMVKYLNFTSNPSQACIVGPS